MNEPGANASLSDELTRTYDRRFAGAQAYRTGVWRILADSYFQKLVPRDAAVLELGCGWGEFINQISAKVKLGMDLNPKSADHLAPGVKFLHQDCASSWALPEGSLDVVFTSNFLEHLPNKELVGQTLAQAFRSLKTHGRIICLGPNIKFVNGAYWDFWDHYTALTESSLIEGLELAGFRRQVVLDRFLPYSMSTGFTPPLWTLRLYLRLPFAWKIFGKQFLVVAEKP